MTDGEDPDDGPSWADLFERGAAYGLSRDAVRTALTAHRGVDREGDR